MQPGSRALTGVVLAAALLASGCGDDDTTGPGDDTARVTVRLTDAPGDVNVAVVTIEEVYLQGGSEGRVTLRDDPLTVDLITLANTAVTIVNDAEIPAGTYSELRFVISGGFIEVETETGTAVYASSPNYAGLPVGVVADGNLIMPSLGASGLKVQFPGSLIFEDDHDLLVDFDVAQSFGHQAGGSGNWVMHPVIQGAETSAAGSILVTLALADGVSLPELNGSVPTLASFSADLDGQTVIFTPSGQAGVYHALFDFRMAGDYDVSIVAPIGVSVTTSPVGTVEVDLAEGQDLTVGFTITAAALLPSP